MHLLDLPAEILLEILGHFDSLSSLHAFSSLCRSTYLLKHDASEQLYRQLCFNLGYTDVTSYGAATGTDTQWQGGWRTSHHDPELELQEVVARQNSLRKKHYIFCVRLWILLGELRTRRDMETHWKCLLTTPTWSCFLAIFIAKMRAGLDRSWRAGTPTFKSTPFERGGPPGGIHRFKLDPDFGLFLTSGVNGITDHFQLAGLNIAAGTAVFDVNGCVEWITPEPTTMYPHVEFSQGFLGTMSGERHVIWQRSDILTPAPKSAISKARRKFYKSRSKHMGFPGGPEFRPFAEVTVPGSLNATKMRDPYYLGSCNQRRALYRFNYHLGTMTTFDISRLWQTTGEDALSDSSITYVEILDRDHVVVAGRKSITLWHPERGCVALFPPVAPERNLISATDSEQVPSIHPRAHYRSNDKQPTWSAVHHDLRHGHLIATSMGQRGVTRSGKLIWIPKWKTLIEGTVEEVEDTTVVLAMVSDVTPSWSSVGGTDRKHENPTQNASIIQLSVENERAAFVTKDLATNTCALWLLNLRPFTSLEDFKNDPPIPICLLFPLPCPQPPARLEMTIDEIALPCCSEFWPIMESLVPGLFDESSQEGLWTRFQQIVDLAKETRPVDMRWETLNAEMLWKQPSRPDPASDRNVLREVEKQWASLLAVADGTMDSMLSVSFGTRFWWT
ncbi:BQ2448_2523 [Microbotryum intermedium]|uniref:BQ2448_2523 protein n=1 Tax=Microbotryum intermedium TaxID=269621 RepID=A0A238FBX3_9BASI|nr:BQ2448_2523 [Microbotryum intermedium]